MPANLPTFTPPQEVQDTAKKGLELAQKTGLVSSAHIREIGTALANGEPHTKERLRHLLSFHRAHSQDAWARGWGSEKHPSPAWISWLLHGGEAGLSWADKQVGKVDMSGPPAGYQHKDFLTPDLEAQQRSTAQRASQEELADREYRQLLDLSDPRINVSRGGRVPPNPFAPKEPAVPGSDEEYRLLLSCSDPRLLWKRR